MKKHAPSSSPWVAVGAAIAGLAVGYSVVILQNPSIVFAKANMCPHTRTCIEGHCNADPTCANGNCGEGCEGCTKERGES